MWFVPILVQYSPISPSMNLILQLEHLVMLQFVHLPHGVFWILMTKIQNILFKNIHLKQTPSLSIKPSFRVYKHRPLLIFPSKELQKVCRSTSFLHVFSLCLLTISLLCIGIWFCKLDTNGTCTCCPSSLCFGVQFWMKSNKAIGPIVVDKIYF